MTARDGIRPGAVAALGAALFVTLLLFAANAGAAILHDQYNNLGPDNGTTSNNPAGPGNDTLLADDFTVPPGFTWTIDGLDVRGNDSPPPFFNVYVYANAGGLPGVELANRGGLAYAGAMKDRSIAIAPPIVLGGGTYWVGAQGGNTNGWGWVERTVQNGLPAVFRTDFGGPCDPNFMPLATCSPGSGPDLAFRINGTAVSPPPPPVTTPITAPAKKKCKRKRKARSAAKKCKKKKKKR